MRASAWRSVLGEVRLKRGHLKSDAQGFLRLVRGPCLGCFALEALEGGRASDLAQLCNLSVRPVAVLLEVRSCRYPPNWPLLFC